MKRAHLLAAIGAILFFVVSCQKTPTAEVSISQNELTASAMGGNISVNVSSNVDLTVRISVPWITQTGAPSGGGGLYSFNVERNSSYDPRTATITFSNGEQGVSETVNVIQSQQDAIIPGKLEYELFYEAQTFTLPISANVDYTVSLDGGDWIKSLGTRGLSSKQYQFSIAENTGKTPREAVLNISSDRMKQSIKIVQLPTTHFPSTRQEWKESIDMTNAIFDVVSKKIDDAFNSGPVEKEQFLNEIRSVNDVVDIKLNQSGTYLGVMQRDSLWVNYSLCNIIEGFSSQATTRANIDNSSKLDTLSLSPYLSNRKYSSTSEKSSSYLCHKGKALILAPFIHQFENERILLEEKQVLKYAGFSEKNIDYYPNEKASIFAFFGDILDDYDFIIINTHGTTGYNARYPVKETVVLDQTLLLSATIYDETTVADYIEKGKLKAEDIALARPARSSNIHLGMTTSFLDNADFKNTCVILESCESSTIMDNSDGGSMIQTLLDRGCAVASGYDGEIENNTGTWMTKHLMFALAEGLSFKDASEYLKASPIFADYCKQLKQYYLDEGTFLWGLIHNTTEEDVASINHKLFHYEQNDPSISYHLMDPYCTLGDVTPSGDGATFSFASSIYPPSAAFTDNDVAKLRKFSFHMSHRALYDIYVDNKLAKAGLKVESQDYLSVNISSISPGSHSWYVVTHIIDNENSQTIAYYKSEEKPFEITAPAVAVTGVKIRPSTVSIEPGETYQLTATVMPDNASNKAVEWKSNHPELVSVDENGLITAIKRQAGTTVYITAKTVDGGKSSTCQVTVKEPSGGEVAVTGISLNQTSAELEVGKTLQLKSTITPSNATNKSVQWTSSNSAVASVDINGLVTAKAIGTAQITAKTEDGGKTATVSITVKKASEQNVPVTGVSINMSSLSLKVGESATLTTTIAPANATNKGVTWTTSMSSVATVTSDGVVTAKAAGTAVITAKTDDGGKTATCNVTVTYTPDPGGEVSVTQVTISPTSANMTVGDTKQFSVKIDPANATNQEVSWSSSDPSVASIDSKGLVTAKAEGKATITVTANDGGVSSKATVTVNNKTVPVTGVSVSPASLSMEIGESKALSVTVSPSDATDKTYTVTSDNTGVVDIDNSNNLVAKGAGTANVLITTSDGGFTAKCVVTVNKPQMTISVEPSSLAFGDVNVGESSTKTFSISNTGKAEVKVSGISVPDAYSVDVTTPFTIAVGQSKTVTVTFTPTDDKDYNGSITITSDADSQPTIAVSGKGIKQSSSETFEAVDLGLSVKWANMNLGAKKPEEYGDYYAWGETELYYSNLNPLTWKEGKELGHAWESYKWCKGDQNSMIKYNTSSDHGYEDFTDGKTVLDLGDDAAHVHLGGKWRMPTYEECLELVNSCSRTGVTQNGINGYLITGNNGNSIFFPAAGYLSGKYKMEVGTRGYYLSSTLYPAFTYGAWRINFKAGDSGSVPKSVGSINRYIGVTIRPVMDK